MSGASVPPLTPVLNGATKFAWMPTDIAQSFADFTVFNSVALGMIAWDVVSNALFDLGVLIEIGQSFKRRPTVALLNGGVYYLLSRIFTLVFIILGVVFLTVGSGVDCQALWDAFSIMNALGTSFTSLLLALRIIALYGLNLRITVPLLVAWVIVLGADFTLRWSENGLPLPDGAGNQLGCALSPVPKSYGYTNLLATLIFDVICCVLIFAKLRSLSSRTAQATGTSSSTKRPLLDLGEAGSLSGRIGRQTIITYTITSVSAIAALTLQNVSSLNGLQRVMWPSTHLVLSNLLASMMFRDLRQNRPTSMSTWGRPGVGSASHAPSDPATSFNARTAGRSFDVRKPAADGFNTAGHVNIPMQATATAAPPWNIHQSPASASFDQMHAGWSKADL
ncbi:hypothetical protein IE81DRAFT_350112 [Ceraceosorus guamensis]|uniref:G-protein coupled receptors family 1 profile domain-containing protein n=1 Tax=Ceraceosorus guamensis TaxID=1522189 RepID=A0A316VPP6_9BASI|nr:hypothetical protein IE81DRAFT_350112 [Ceraceosorus guamensis]PWN39492.1 hypothetical protein IE81DRAFT_350112 [Ceraceosorus guamensis]